MTLSILRLPEVKSRTGLSRASIYAFMKKREFPDSIRLGPRCIGWRSLDIENWIAGRQYHCMAE